LGKVAEVFVGSARIHARRGRLNAGQRSRFSSRARAAASARLAAPSLR
jgi:hypothetical protein